MSRDDAERFVKDVAETEELRKELAERLNFSNNEDLSADAVRERMARVAPEFASEHGYEFTAEEGFHVIEEITEVESDELSDGELEEVAGGKPMDAGDVMAGIGTTIVTVAVGCLVSLGQEVENGSCFVDGDD